MSRERELQEVDEIKREVVEGFYPLMGRRQILSQAGALNTITPCAACKLLRRRCAQECPFSPYFSPHEPHKFASVHKVFGASNVAKMLMEVPESQRADAANSLVYEANLRLRDPVYGCMGAISALQHQLQTLQADLNAIRTEILKYKYREAIIPSPSSSSSSHIAFISATGLVSTTATPPTAPPTPPPSQPPPLSLPPPLPPSSSSSIFSPPISTTTAPQLINPISTQHIPYFG
ncbi:LOB domain-containing protein 15-like [Cucurbita maxima]|uniref:LOB domain-containing protein 15-like n=2 Tax=Cucurbita TaxID=3660 RepID=A0A6J1JXN5_CUCMA|nr:LOB domain-containing protein 15-like [Cucurbita moschata]XP_022993125.1 LOB domain-containing protein 15-like [Cucurbita maxima]